MENLNKILRKETLMKNKFGLKKLAPFGIGLLVLATFVGSISGSLAWWAYSTRVAVSYQGTSVSTSEQLQIGLKLDSAKFTDEEIEDLGLEEDVSLAGGGYRYVFSKAGGGLPANTISKYLEAEGVYATNELAPVTSGTYTSGTSGFGLKESLISGHQNNTTPALTSKYVHIPFVFRILKLNAVGESDKYAGERDIYLSKVVAEASSANASAKVQNALRMHINNGTVSEQFILNPGSEETDPSKMYTTVAGALDLNKDGYYDYDNSGEEIVYGYYSGTPTHLVADAPAPTVLSDINNVGASSEELADLSNFTTFLAAHGTGKTYYEDYDGLTLGTAQYKTMSQIKPDDTQPTLVGGLALCQTASSGNYLAELETTIWLEGWDHNVVDSEKSHQFNLGLQFIIDLVN